MNDQQHFYVPKSTGTLTDTLVVFGLARVLEDFLKHYTSSVQVTIEDNGGYYIVDTGTPIRDEWITNVQAFETIPFVTSGRFPKPADLPTIRSRDVDGTWDRFKTYVERQKELRAEKIGGVELEQATADWKPENDWTVVTYLGDYRMQAQEIHNKLVEQWLRSGEAFAPLNMRTLLALFAGPIVDQERVAADWKATTKDTKFGDSATASQLFNPHMGKGQNRSKANKLTMGNEKSFWLLEYLKAVGLWTACAPTATTNANLRKTYVLAPRSLEFRYHQRVFGRFRDRLWNEGPVKQDIKAVLLYTLVLLEESIENDNLDVFGGGGVSNVVGGMNVATYQLLSANSYTTINLSFLGLPDWMPSIVSSDAAADYIEVLQEHLDRIDAIDRERETSEGYALLQLYRDFLSGNYLNPFFAFLSGYCSYLISAINRSNYFVKPFSETNLRRLIQMKKTELSPILENEGFRNIAYAIRMSTIVPLYRGKDSSYEVRFGLGQELLRHAQYCDEFVQALGKFIHSYNDETSRVQRQTGKQFRSLVTVDAVEQIVKLIDEYDSKTVCNLLVAFGYARDPKELTDREQKPVGQDEIQSSEA
jgi:hypothetical protein